MEATMAPAGITVPVAPVSPNGSVWRRPPQVYAGRATGMSVVVSDLHVPHHSEETFELFIDFIGRERPRLIHLLGDMIDLEPLARFRKSPETAIRLQDDIDATVAVLRRIRNTCPDSGIIYAKGNHEERLEKAILDKLPPVSKLRALDLQSLLSLDELQISWHPWVDRPYRVGELHYMHGRTARNHSGVTARAHLDRMGKCMMTGHGHRMASIYRSQMDDTLGSWESGCMCDWKKLDYTAMPDWQLGWNVVWHERDRFDVEQVSVINNVYSWRGQTYGRPSSSAYWVPEDPAAMGAV